MAPSKSFRHRNLGTGESGKQMNLFDPLLPSLQIFCGAQ
jgi:hypothetical protein